MRFMPGWCRGERRAGHVVGDEAGEAEAPSLNVHAADFAGELAQRIAAPGVDGELQLQAAPRFGHDRTGRGAVAADAAGLLKRLLWPKR